MRNLVWTRMGGRLSLRPTTRSVLGNASRHPNMVIPVKCKLHRLWLAREDSLPRCALGTWETALGSGLTTPRAADATAGAARPCPVYVDVVACAPAERFQRN